MATVAHTCNPKTGEMGTERSLSASLAYLASSSPVSDHGSKQVNGTWRMTSIQDCLLAFTCMHTYRKVGVPSHTETKYKTVLHTKSNEWSTISKTRWINLTKVILKKVAKHNSYCMTLLMESSYACGEKGLKWQGTQWWYLKTSNGWFLMLLQFVQTMDYCICILILLHLYSYKNRNQLKN